MGGPRSPYGTDEKCMQSFFIEKPEGKSHVEGLDVDGNLIDWVLRKWGGQVWAGFMWIGIGASGGPV